MKDINTKQIINLLLSKENEISNKFHNAINELLRLGYDSERGKGIVTDLIDSIEYTLEEIDRITKR